MKASSRNTKKIQASAELLYDCFLNPDALAIWLAPGNMTGKVHDFELKIGGGYTMSLFYPEDTPANEGKTADKEDRFYARFMEFIPFKKIVESIHFDSSNTDFSGEMIMRVNLRRISNDWTEVIIVFTNIPKGIEPKENEKGTDMSLDKLALYVSNIKQK